RGSRKRRRVVRARNRRAHQEYSAQAGIRFAQPAIRADCVRHRLQVRGVMMWHRYHRRRPPPWWPAGESWPPIDRALAWRHGRARFVRRVLFLVAGLLFLSAIGTVALISKLFGAYGPDRALHIPPIAIAT